MLTCYSFVFPISILFLLVYLNASFAFAIVNIICLSSLFIPNLISYPIFLFTIVQSSGTIQIIKVYLTFAKGWQ